MGFKKQNNKILLKEYMSLTSLKGFPGDSVVKNSPLAMHETQVLSLG